MSAIPEPLRPEDLARLAGAGRPALRPQGDAAVYTLTHFDGGERATDLVWVSASGEGRWLTHDGASEDPAWSPDGVRVAFVSRRGGAFGLYVLDMRGGEALRLADFAGEPRQPVWSPDGRHIALEVLDPAPDPLAPRVVRRLRYNVNGRAFIGDRRWRVVVVDASDGTARALGDAEFHHFSPAWAPDGRRLALVTTRRTDWDLEWVWDVYVVDIPLDRWTRLTASDGVALYPAWSPDGTRVAFLHNHRPWTGTTSDYHLFEAPADGSAPARCLSHSLDRGAADVYEPPIVGGGPPAYAADGQSVLWLANDRGVRVLEATACDGSGTRPVARHVGWPSLDASRNRGAALVYGPDRPPEVALLSLPDGGVRAITDLNPWLSGRSLARPPETIVLDSPHGPVEAVLWRPRQEPPRGGGPALVQFHGGPHGAFGPYFNPLDQMLAGAGYLVANLNYRGSAGYGQAFADLVHADWGPKEGEDGARLIDHLCRQGWARPDAVGVYGISYGGFMTNWMLGRYAGKVRAGVTISTVASLFTSAYGIDHWESIATDMGGRPWEIPDYYRDHSPARYLPDMEAPLLILHGEEDMTCPLIEAEILFVGLRWQGKTVEFVRYPGEHHSFLRAGRLGTMVDAHRRILAWFDRHLRGGATT